MQCSEQLLVVNYLKMHECFLASKNKISTQYDEVHKYIVERRKMLVLLISHQLWISNFGFVMLNHIGTMDKKK